MQDRLLPNTTISHYRILDKLGVGGMGEVWLAEDTRLGRKLALKLLPAEFTRDAARVARFELEARAASALNHPNIITIYDIGQSEGIHFIATEFIEGRTLRHCLTSYGLQLREALEITVQIAGALQAAHGAGITHRDIKPENVMLRPDGYIKVLDFGLAKLTEKIESQVDTEALTKIKSSTDPGTVMGTVSYMSPEQARGLKVDARSDIFSLGVVFYELLTGRLPFSGETSTDVLAAILTAEPRSLSQYAISVPAELEWSLLKALQKSCEERYQTMKSFLDDLRRVKSQLDFEAQLAQITQSQSLIRSSEEVSEAVTVEFRSDEWFRSKSISGQTKSRLTSPGQVIDSLAILPLANASNDANMEYLSDGITESIINSLSQLPQLRVVPRSTVFRYKGQEVDPQQIGADLNVRAVLSGRVLQLGDSLIVKTELVDVLKQSQLWGEQYRRRLKDIFELQEEIANEISSKLQLRLSGEEKQRLIKRYTDNIEAYHLYLKGRYYNNKRTPEWIRKGIDHFKQAIDLDPNYALAYAGLADSYAFLASATGGQQPRETYPLAKAAALKALELDDSLGEAHCSLGFFRLLYDWDFPAAEREYKRAIELSPNYANAHDGYGFYLKSTGQHEAAIASCRRALELDPLSLFVQLSLGWAFYFARRYDDALAQSRKVMEMDPNFGFAHWHSGMNYIQQQKYDEAIESFRKAISLTGRVPTFISYLGYAQARKGRFREARQMLAQLESMSKQQYVSSYFIAVIHLGLDDYHQVFEWLDKACEERAGFLAFARVEPMLDAIRGDKRFERLLEKMKLVVL
jgi:serine/threonine protein kinase/Tfp pilus assembly protein PilF